MKEELILWIEHYLRNKDLLLHAITAIDKGKDGWDLVVHKGQALLYVAVLADLAAAASTIERLKDKTVNLIVPNTGQNLQALIDNWQALAQLPGLTLFFVNPTSKTEMRWVIMPHVHDKITEKSALKLGLKSLFETVEEYPSQ
jgi:hypothetical protein